MISGASICNFKCLRCVRIELEPFTVFVGPNASGKSSILQALDLLCQLFDTGDPRSREALLERSRSRIAEPHQPVELAAESDGQAYRFRYSPRASRAKQARPQTPRIEWPGERWAIASSLDSSDWKQYLAKSGSPPPLPKSVLLHLESSKLLDPKPNSYDPAVMSSDGAGLHSALASMALNDRASWIELQANLTRIIPTLRGLRHTPLMKNRSPALLFDTTGAENLPADQVSEGTLLVLGLLAALHAPGRPDLILLDDVDRGLHPKAQRELISLLRELMKVNPALQIVATTHSPYLLDCMEPNEVRMTYLDNGQTVCASLTDHPKFQRWKDEFHSGEMWSLFGEQWVAEKEVATS